MITCFGEGVVVQGCAYGGRLTGKGYRFWMSAETLEVFLERQILPKDKASLCKACKANRKHRQAAYPQKGDDRGRESIPGETKNATKNRIPRRLVALIGECMIEGRRRKESMQGSCQEKAQLIKAATQSKTSSVQSKTLTSTLSDRARSSKKMTAEAAGRLWDTPGDTRAGVSQNGEQDVHVAETTGQSVQVAEIQCSYDACV